MNEVPLGEIWVKDCQGWLESPIQWHTCGEVLCTSPVSPPMTMVQCQHDVHFSPVLLCCWPPGWMEAWTKLEQICQVRGHLRVCCPQAELWCPAQGFGLGYLHWGVDTVEGLPERAKSWKTSPYHAFIIHPPPTPTLAVLKWEQIALAFLSSSGEDPRCLGRLSVFLWP